MKTTTLYRPVNGQELALIQQLDNKAFPPRLPEQPFFYPVMNEAYAVEITRKWNVSDFGEGYVLRFEVDSAYLAQFKVENVGGHHHNELWIPAEDLDTFNQHIIGEIEVIGTYKD